MNQNQIHLHLHGPTPDKLEQYLNPENVMISSIRSASATTSGGGGGGVEVGIGTDSPAAQLGLMTETEGADEVTENREDPNNVWRPY